MTYGEIEAVTMFMIRWSVLVHRIKRFEDLKLIV